MTIAANEADAWANLRDAGWLTTATWKGSGVDAFFEQPGALTANGMVSTDYAIQYRAADAAMKEGDAIAVDGRKFKVRETPQVTSSHTGFFKRAVLTSLK